MTVGFRDARNADWQCSVGRIRDVHFVLNSIIFYKGWHPKLIAAFPHEGIICTQFPGHVYSVPHVQDSSNMWKYCKLDQKKEKKEGKNLEKENLRKCREAERGEMLVQLQARSIWLSISPGCLDPEHRDRSGLTALWWLTWWWRGYKERKRREKGCAVPLAPL